jgi:hypothetical protein
VGAETDREGRLRGDVPQTVPTRELEAIKLRYDMYKHLTTMCSGAVALAVSVVGALFEEPEGVLLFVASALLLLVGAVLSALCLRDIVHDLDDADSRLGRSNLQFWAWSAFFVGLLLFGVFALLNLA